MTELGLPESRKILKQQWSLSLVYVMDQGSERPLKGLAFLPPTQSSQLSSSVETKEKEKKSKTSETVPKIESN